MSRLIPPALYAHLQLDEQTTAVCWLIELRDGRQIRGTEHDEDVVIPDGSPTDVLSGLYLAAANITGSDIRNTTDMSVENTEVEGAFQKNQTITDVTVADMEGGLLNRAPVWVLLVNWRAPADGLLVLRRGYLGELERDSDGHYKTEVRGLGQLLAQQIIRTYGVNCDVVRFGDARCKKDVAAITITATVTNVETKRRFTVSGITIQPAGYFSTGILRGLTGANVGYEREVKRDDYNGQTGRLELWESMPVLPGLGDTFALEPGCDRRKSTCKDVHDNLVNFRGHGWAIPGALALLKGPT